ncbi:MAG: alpha/beta fold hydrolase [Candidatus Thorarchaeota archaeon]
MLEFIQGKQTVRLSNSIQLDLLIKGQGNPVLWLHSGFRGRIGLGNLVTAVEKKLKQENNAWLHIIPNLPGFGESTPGPSGNTNPYELTDAIEELICLLNYPSIDVIGYSLGANIASILANRNPEKIHRVVLLGTAIEGSNLDIYRRMLDMHNDQNWEGLVNEIAQNLVGKKNRSQYARMMPLVKKQVSSKRFSQDLTRILSSGVRLDVFKEIESITHPMLMISGKEDPFVPRPGRIEMLKQKDNIKLVLLDGIGHNELVFPRQIDLSDQIIDFLQN